MSILLAELERMDTWVLKVGIAIPIVAVLVLAVWHLCAYLAGKFAKARRKRRFAPEPLPYGIPENPLLDQLRSSAPFSDKGDHLKEGIRPDLRLPTLLSARRSSNWQDRIRALAAIFPDHFGDVDQRDVMAEGDDTERLKRLIASLTELLAEIYLDMADSWSRTGRSQEAADALKMVLQICPGPLQVEEATKRLQQLDAAREQG